MKFLSLDFNSIKVRLKRSKPREPDGDLDEFQFHKGTIKTTPASVILLVLPNFNSIKVRLKLSSVLFPNVVISYFNSIKVRLKPKPREPDGDLDEFQFHKGTIKTEAHGLQLSRPYISIP